MLKPHTPPRGGGGGGACLPLRVPHNAPDGAAAALHLAPRRPLSFGSRRPRGCPGPLRTPSHRPDEAVVAVHCMPVPHAAVAIASALWPVPAMFAAVQADPPGLWHPATPGPPATAKWPEARAPFNTSAPLLRGGGSHNQHNPQYANYWAPLTRKRHIPPHPAQPRHPNDWAPRTRKRHQREHRPQRPTERSDPTQHAKGRTGDCPGPRKGATTGRNVTQEDPPPPLKRLGKMFFRAFGLASQKISLAPSAPIR